MQKTVACCLFTTLFLFVGVGLASRVVLNIPPPVQAWGGPINYIKEAVEYACDPTSGHNLSEADCLSVLRFLIVNYGAGSRQFTFSVPLTLGGQEQPVTPWLRGAPLKAGTANTGQSTPNTCVSNVLLNPPSPKEYVETTSFIIPELLQEVGRTSPSYPIDNQQAFVVDETRLKNVCRELGADHHFPAVLQKAKDLAAGGTETVLELQIDHVIRLPVYVDSSLHNLIISPRENPFVACNLFCDRFAFSDEDCSTLTTEALASFAISLQSRIMKCKGVSVLYSDEHSTRSPLSFHLWSSPAHWEGDRAAVAGDSVEILYPLTGSILHIKGDDDVFNGIRVKLHSPLDNAPVFAIVRLALNHHPLYLHDCTVNSSLLDVNLSFLKIGTWNVQAQIGVYQQTMANSGDGTVIWGPVTESIFDIAPSFIYHPDLQNLAASGAREQNQAGQGLGAPLRKPIQVIHITSVGGLDGQSRVLVSAALNMDPRKVKVTFVTTKKNSPPPDIMEHLDSKDIDYLHVPIVIPSNIYNGVFDSSLAPFIKMLETARSIFDLRKDVQGIINEMVATLRGADIVTFTNIAPRVAEDTILAHAARLANVPIILCDPGNIEKRDVPTVHGVSGLLVPSYRAKRHWQDMGVRLPIHVVWPGADEHHEIPQRIVSGEKVVSIVWTGRVHANKSPGLFVQAAAAIAKRWGERIRFFVLGDGFLRPSLEKLAYGHFQFSRKDFIFLGKLTNKDVVQFLRTNASMLIHTTLLNETFGLAVVEGLLAGLPVVTYGVGGIADYLPLNNADIGYVAPEPSLGSLVDTALNALNDRKNGIALRGKQYAEDNMLTVKGMAARFQRLYCKLLNSLPQQTMDHRRRMTVLARDTEGVLAFNLGSAHRLSTNISVHKAWFLRNRRLRNHRGIPLNECCCGNCALKMGEDWQKWFSLRRKISMDYYQNFSTEQYLDLTRSANPNTTPRLTYPKVVGSSPIASQTRGTFVLTTLHKLEHDIQQMNYLIDLGKLPPSFSLVVQNFTEVYGMEYDKPNKTKDRYIYLGPKYIDKIGMYYNMLLYMPLPTLTTVSPHAINPLLNFAAIEQDYFMNAPGFTFIDNLLSLGALSQLRSFLLESTIYFDVKTGYLGAYHDEGLNGPLLRQIERELKHFMPRIFRKELPLINMWSYKCDQRYVEGLNVHADAAQVNFNIWITENDANLDESSGGLIVYLTSAPATWDFASFNALDSKGKIYEFLDSVNAEKRVVPFRENRAVVFHSQLFHESDRFVFKKGYKNRRINLTLLFGRMKNFLSRGA